MFNGITEAKELYGISNHREEFFSKLDVAVNWIKLPQA
jgi:hypothetical protein